MTEKVKKGTGLERNLAAALSYSLLWLSGVIFLIVEKDEFVRFHAMQSILTFGALTVLSFVPLVGAILSPFIALVTFVLWLVLIYKAYQGEEFKLPVIGDFAKEQLKKVK